MNKSFGLVPLINFGIVREPEMLNESWGATIYRCAQPQFEYQYNWIKNVLGVTYIVNLRSEKHHDDLMNKDRFYVHNIDIPDHHEPTLEQAKNFMQFIRDCNAQGHKVLIHCAHGHGRTSTFSVLSKLVLGYTLEEALNDEYDRFHYTFRHHAQIEFLETHFSNYEAEAI